MVGRPPYAGELELLGNGRARRRTCCLFYEVPGAGLCGDCVFDHPPGPSTGTGASR
jgi:ferric iron reductase protein FhuF